MPHQLTINFPKLEEEEWFMVNLKKRTIADKPGNLGFKRLYPEIGTQPGLNTIQLSDNYHAHLLAPVGIKIIVYGRKQSWPDFYALHHVLRTPKGYESKSGYLECT